MAEFDQESDIIFLYNSSGDNNYEDYESGSENENEEQVLSIGKEFDSWEEVNRFFDEYALSKGFAIRKCRGDYISLEDSSQRLRQRTSNSIGCLWKASLNWPKTSPAIHLTSYNDDHNHSLNPLIHKTSPKY
ncbi:6759_t:CDS:2 [Rhizophagus irregularis]|nr:6759_t:CDS:2 [Rhizophagus irregularis]